MKISRFIPAALLIGGMAVADAEAARELVQNPLLEKGKDGTPLNWKSEAYRAEPTDTQFGWRVDASGIGVLEIESRTPNDARYVQTVAVSPNTWYHVGAWGRTENVGSNEMGLHLSIMGTFHNSRDLRGTSPWQPLGLWVKTGSLETKLQVGCRLGGYSSLNTGKGWCTGISVIAAGSPEPSESFVYGRDAEEEPTGGHFGIQAIAVLVVLGLLLLIWRYVLPPSKQIPE